MDVLNGVSGMEHLSNSIVRRPLQNYSMQGYQPTIVNRETALNRNISLPEIRSRDPSRENSRDNSANPEVVYDPFWANQQRYIAH